MANKKKFSKKSMLPDPRKRKSRIVMDSELKDMKERIKKKKETGDKDVLIGRGVIPKPKKRVI